MKTTDHPDRRRFQKEKSSMKTKKSPVTHGNQLDSRWFEGRFLGFHSNSDEFLIGTPNGIERVRTMRRKPLDSRWNIRVLNNLGGLP